MRWEPRRYKVLPYLGMEARLRGIKMPGSRSKKPIILSRSKIEVDKIGKVNSGGNIVGYVGRQHQGEKRRIIVVRK